MNFLEAANIIKHCGRVKRTAWKDSPSMERNNGWIQMMHGAVWYLSFDRCCSTKYIPSWEDIWANDWVEQETTEQVLNVVERLY